MKIHLNGDSIDLTQSVVLIEILRQKNIPETGVVIELNGEILSDFNVMLKEGDQVEIIRMVGGG